jgi:uncharacterized membrane protein
MDARLHEWLNLALRWFHVVAGVYWIGQTALFSFLDSRLTIERAPDGTREMWMVHSGGFYRVEKRDFGRPLPALLHWFKWEAAFTWLSGFLLLLLVYYAGGVLVDPSAGVDPWFARLVGLGSLPIGYKIYDLLWNGPFRQRERLGELVTFALLVAAAWGLGQVLSGRAAYIHAGALIGTIMAANVWERILPAQKKILAAVEAGKVPDLSLAERAKQRSRHNTYLAIPVLLVMVSNHFPTTTYGHRHAWLTFAGFLVAGFAARALIDRANRKPVTVS